MTRIALHIAACWLVTFVVAANGNALDLPESAVAEDAVDGTEPRVRSSLVVDQTTVVAGQPFWAGVHFELDEHWHIYWRNPGQAAYSTELIWGDTVTASPNLWPAPEVFEQNDGFIVTYGYSHAVTLPAQLVTTAARGTLELSVVADYLACRVDCIPGRVELRRSIEVAEAPVAAPETERTLIRAARDAVPPSPADLGLSLSSALERSALRRGDTLRATVAFASCLEPPAPGQACAELGAGRATAVQALVPDRTPTIGVRPVALRPHPTAYRGVAFDLELAASPDNPNAAEQTVSGVAFLDVDGVSRPVEFSFVVPRADADAATEPVVSGLFAVEPDGAAPAEPGTVTETATTTQPRIGLLYALLLAFAGGMLLNLMPCVLPVLAIKVMSITELAHGARREARRQAAAWTVGVVASMLALAGIVLALRTAGTAVGWGFQFQQPAFVAVVAAVIFAFALNLLGVFEVSVSANRLDAVARRQSGWSKSVLEGVLAVVLATPCSAPLVGSAIGFALASPPLTVLGVFASLGLGLAAPFVAVALLPGVARLIPKPGMWMVHFRSVLGFVLLATVVWLLWVLGQSAGTNATALSLALLVAVGFAAWSVHIVQHGARRIALVAGGMVLIAMAVWTLPGISRGVGSSEQPATRQAALQWQPWSPEAVAAGQAEGRVVFVDFTADWCITCKVNENGPLQAASVREAFAEHDVLLLKADWTRRDDTIRAELARHGKGGVPLYLVFPPERDAPASVLPELLTASIIVDSVRAAAGSIP